MKKKFTINQRILSILLCASLLIGLIPLSPLTAATANGVDRVADPSTFNDWRALFLDSHVSGVDLTTENAGGVWTDKSVFSADSIPQEITNAVSLEQNHPDLVDTGDNFMVALSAIASNKEIVGYSTIPTDTVLILDLSRSMRTNDNRDGSAIDELVDATNKAITDLLALNKNNRVSVVMYSGNINASFSSGEGATVTVMPLGTYTPARTVTQGGEQVGIFLESIPYTNTGVESWYRGTPDWAVQVASGVKNASGASISGVKNTEAGTYTQDGIYEAMKVLLGVDKEDTRISSGVQAGTDRIPIMVLMTDGEPTLANPDYNGNDARTHSQSCAAA